MPSQQRILICFFLGLATILTFWPLTRHEFISYDDAIYITGNPHVRAGLTAESVGWAFTNGEAGNWHPVTWLSHMLDVQMFGLQPGWHHLVTVIIHAANTILLFLLLHQLTKAAWRSAFVAALFALHPLHVQSVAWAAERKDVLSALFFMLTLLAYARCVMPEFPAGNPATQPAARARSLPFYVLSLMFFALGLMSKPMLVTLPFVLLLLDYWPLRRLAIDPGVGFAKRLAPLFVEKIPFLALVVLSCVITLVVQKKGGAVVPIGVLSFGGRMANALAAYVDYLRQTIWPTGLTLLYPFEDIPSTGKLVICGLILLLITAWAIRGLRQSPHLAVGWFWYLGMLVPVIGIVQVGMQQRADRYTYLPLIGIFIMLTWEICERFASTRAARTILPAMAAVALAVCVGVTRAQIGCWQDSEHIFERAVKMSPSNYVALNNYGLALLKRGDVDGAIQVFEQAVKLKPELDAARIGLGTALMEQKKFDTAAQQFNTVLNLQPANSSALLQLGILLARQGKLPEAAECLSKALSQNPNDSGARNNFGNVLLLQGKYEDAAKQFQEALRLQPDYAIAYYNLATCLRKVGRIPEAIENYRQSLRLQPNSVEALNYLAWILATQPNAQFRDGAQAVQLAVRAGELTHYQNPIVLVTLSAAFAEAGQFAEAINYAELAQKIAAASHSPIEAQAAGLLVEFRAGRAYHAE